MRDSHALTAIFEHAAQRPEAVAVLAPDRAPLDFASIRQQINAILAALQSRGIARNDRVAVIYEGRIVGELFEEDRETIGLMMTGQLRQDEDGQLRQDEIAQ